MMRLWRTNPMNGVTIARGEGARVWDDRGRRYVDLLSGTWCNALGYGHPAWIAAVRDQAGRLVHAGAPFETTEVSAALAELTGILPAALNRAVLTNTGSESVELALKIARAAAGRDGIAVIGGGYYGATVYALALSESGRNASYLPAFGGVMRLRAPHCVRCPERETCTGSCPCLDPLAELAGSANLSAILYEPVIGGGILTPPVGYGKRLRSLADDCGALLIAEEVTTGMGRTGRWFGFEHDGIAPDILVIGKILGGGLPVAAVITTEDVERRSADVLGRHVQSHQNDPFSGRIAAAVISILRKEGLVERAASIGARLIDGLRTATGSCSWVREVRGRGAMVGVELAQDRAERGPALSRSLFEAGFIQDFHVPTATLRMFPPFVTATDDLDAFADAFGRIGASVC